MNKIGKPVSVIVCTCGTHPYIGEVFDALRTQTFGNFQLILVDNNPVPSDFSEFLYGSEDVKILHLPESNLSAARNLAIEHAEGDFILFLDDDALPNPGWVEKILAGFEKYKSDMIGGRVNLILKSTTPWWFTHACRGFLSELEYYDEDVEIIIPPRYVVGANMAFTAGAFEKFGLFLKDSGRIGKKLISLEDVEMVRRIYNNGGKISYLNDARVRHVIPDYRIKITYLLKRAFWQGISDVMLEKIHPLHNKKKKKIPLNFTLLLEMSRVLGRVSYRSILCVKRLFTPNHR